jgi:DNA-binding transcriptional LysR family regulator
VGIAVIPESAALRCKKTMNLRVVTLTDIWATRQLMLCVRDFANQPLHVRELIEHIRERATPPEP